MNLCICIDNVWYAQSTYDYSEMMALINEQDPENPGLPNCNTAAYLAGRIDLTLEWAMTTPQLLTNRVTYLLAFMYISERFRKLIKSATRGGIGRVYMDGTADIVDYPFDVLSFEDRYRRYTFGEFHGTVEGNSATSATVRIAALLPPQIVAEEWLLYKAIVDCPATANHGTKSGASRSRGCPGRPSSAWSRGVRSASTGQRTVSATL